MAERRGLMGGKVHRDIVGVERCSGDYVVLKG